jgi:hypothetical protein
MYCTISLIRASKHLIVHTNAHKMINLMAPKSDRKWCEHLPFGQSLPPTYQYILFMPSLLQLVILDPHKNHSTPSPVHQQWSFTGFGFPTLPPPINHWTFALSMEEERWMRLEAWIYRCQLGGENNWLRVRVAQRLVGTGVNKNQVDMSN